MGATHAKPIDYDATLLASMVAQSKSVKDETGTDSKIYRSVNSSDKLVEFPFENDDSKQTVKTLWQAFTNGCKINPNGKCLGYRPFIDGSTARAPYQWLTYTDVYNRAVSLAVNLSNMDIFESNTQENIGIFAKNRAEWTITMLSIWHQNHRVIPLYDTLGDEATNYILKQTGLKLLFAETSNLSKVWNALAAQNDTNNSDESKENNETVGNIGLKTIVYFDTWQPYNNTNEIITDEDEKNADKYNIQLIRFSDLISKYGGSNGETIENIEIIIDKTFENNNNNDESDEKKDELLCKSIKEDDLGIIMYTSGTTGLPKGVMLTHGNVISTVAAFSESKYMQVDLGPTDRHISYLPLAHIFEIAVECTMLCVGGAIGFFQGDIRKITDDFAALKPTILCGVPRVFQKVYDKVQTQASQASFIKKWLINKALYSGTNIVRKKGSTKGTIWDKLVFSKIKIGAGWTQVKVIVSGAAPLPGYLMEFLQVVTAADVRQGYGMTETVCAGGFTTFGDFNVGHVGPATPNCEFKLRDVPEMNYFHTDVQPRGEILIRGPSIFQGYYQLPDKTNETLVKSTDKDAKYDWIATGDIGRINPNGTLTIIDRRKNIFKLGQGEYVAVEKIESSYLKISCINQIWVYGNSFKTILVAVVVPDAAWLNDVASSKGWDTVSSNIAVGSTQHCDWFEKTVDNHYDQIKSMILSDMKSNGEHGLKGFEKVKDILLVNQIGELLTGFTVENDLLTPSMKLKRPMLLKKYVQELKDLYKQNGQPPNENEHWVKN